VLDIATVAAADEDEDDEDYKEEDAGDVTDVVVAVVVAVVAVGLLVLRIKPNFVVYDGPEMLNPALVPLKRLNGRKKPLNLPCAMPQYNCP
jgi:uncharacterized protein (DUF983 family)